MASYVAGDRVWVFIDGDGWWPARVLGDAEIQTRTPGLDIAVQFYAGIETPVSLYELNSHSDRENICYFETSSEKAVTANADLEASIRHAAEDASANPLKSASAIVAGVGAAANAGAPAGASAAVNRAATKRIRDAIDEGFRGGAKAHGSSGAMGFVHLRTEELQDAAQKVRDAVATDDVAAARAALCRLDNVDVFLSELEESKIGVAVGSVLSRPSLKSLWPLARAMVSFWARHLPPETLAAIRSVQQKDEPTIVEEAVQAAAVQSSSLKTQQRPSALTLSFSPSASQPAVATATTATTTAATAAAAAAAAAAAPVKKFYENIYQLLDSPLSTTRYTEEVIEEVARKLSEEITDKDDRQLLLLRLREQELSFIRDNLLSGEWTPKKYLDQPEEVFTTKSEKEAQERRIQEKIKAVEAADNANLNITALFKCGRCGKRHCTFYEQQTRSADEPTTKYITCLNCKNTWTQE